MDSSIWQHPDIIQHSQRLAHSYQIWTGRSLLLEPDSPEQLAYQLFTAPFALLSHGMQADPIFNYGNQTALTLWDVSWTELTQMPSRYSAEPQERDARDRLLTEATHQGYIANYAGVRISRTGRRFAIVDAEIWDVVDADGRKWGQAARFDQWQWLLDHNRSG